jgi:hypothetical protein
MPTARRTKAKNTDYYEEENCQSAALSWATIVKHTVFWKMGCYKRILEATRDPLWSYVLFAYAFSRMNKLTVDGCKITWWMRGQGPAILFIQGCGVQGSGWLPQIEALSEKYTCIWFDNRGIG